MAIETQTVITDLRSTVNTTGEPIHIRDVDSDMHLLQPYQTPIDDFFASQKWGEITTYGERGKYEWFEDKFLPDSTTTTKAIAGGSNTESSLTIANEYFQQWDTILIESTREVCVITNDCIGTTTIDLALNGSGNITAAASGVRIQRLVPAFRETSTKQISISVLQVDKSTFPQIMKRALGMTGRQQAAKIHTGDDWSFQWMKAGMELKEAMERARLNNTDGYDNTTTGQTFMTGFGSLSTNVIPYSGSLDKSEWNAGIKQISEAGKSSYLVAMAGGQALQDIADFMEVKYEFRQTDARFTMQQYGFASAVNMKPLYMQYKHPQCIVDIVWNPQLSGSNLETDIVVFNPENVKRLVMGRDNKGERKFRIEKSIETPGNDSSEAQYLADQGMKIVYEEQHGRFRKS